MSTLGPMFSAARIETAAQDTLQTWIETYLAQFERDNTLTPRSLPKPRSYVLNPRPAKYDEDQVPAIVIVCGGTVDPPERHGDGTITAWFSLGVGVLVSASDRYKTLQLAKDYGAIIRALISEKDTLGGVAQETIWERDEYADAGSNSGRREFASAVMSFRTCINGVANFLEGIDEPPSDPYDTLPDRPTVDEADVTITNVPADEEL
jgi:hypothetical protein